MVVPNTSATTITTRSRATRSSEASTSTPFLATFPTKTNSIDCARSRKSHGSSRSRTHESILRRSTYSNVANHSSGGEEMSSSVFRLLVSLAVMLSLVNLFVFIPGRSGWITVFLIPALVGFRYLGFKKGLLLAVALGLAVLMLRFSLEVTVLEWWCVSR